MTRKADIDVDPKRARILEGAMRLVLAYGYSRVTMEDLAREAEISRPALYLLFKNKTDIYRAVASQMLEASVATVAAELAREGDFGARMTAAIEQGIVATMRHISESPHGAELMDMKNSLAGDLAARWRDCMAWHFCSAIDNEATRNGVDLSARGLSPHLLADLLLDGLEGMKERTRDVAAQSATATGLVRVIERAIAG